MQFAAACKRVNLSLSMPWRHRGEAQVLIHLFLTQNYVDMNDLPNAQAILP